MDAYDYDREAEESDLAHMIDGSGYYAAIRVREDFGCAMFEKGE
jgi:hypothetical protein